ncbi:MAG: AAA family ATPase [Deltaproteobacteria bacterium]|nr:AAA family ATPase [Deltaproteobacteria bacterium]
MNPKTIAFLGKGGSGKSILSSLTAKLFLNQGKKLLLIDADPAMGLATALNVENFKTIGKAREEIIRQAKISRKDESARLSEIIDYLLLEALYETAQYSLLVMGHTDTVGCYCPINSLLRETIDSISSNYDVVIIDAEAGIEQINREVTQSVDYPILLTDNSMRGAKTTVLAKETIDSSPGMEPLKTGVIFNRVESFEPGLENIIKEKGLSIYGVIPPDKNITSLDSRGENAFLIPEDSISLTALKNILEKEGII